MAAATGVWNHTAAGQSALQAKATTDSTASGSSSTSSSTSTISSNDFLTLLVTEMQNQDPTANTDPNEYINQLVNVNSLEQLISINQVLTDSLGSSSDGQQSHSTTATTSVASADSSSGSTATPAAQSTLQRFAPGNLSVPSANPSAERVATALSGQRDSR